MRASGSHVGAFGLTSGCLGGSFWVCLGYISAHFRVVLERLLEYQGCVGYKWSSGFPWLVDFLGLSVDHHGAIIEQNISVHLYVFTHIHTFFF